VTTDVPARSWASGSGLGELTPRTAETAAERRRYVEEGLTPIACERCATTVLVKKHSAKHTSVQWHTDAASSCPEIAAQVAARARSALVLGCPMLQRSIAAAVADGALAVPDD
jgi:hypothetical protein